MRHARFAALVGLALATAGVAYGFIRLSASTPRQRYVGPLIPETMAVGMAQVDIPLGESARQESADRPPAHATGRFGFGISKPADALHWAKELGAGWYLDWSTRGIPGGEGVDYWRMIRISEESTTPSIDEVTRLAADSPGQVWILGNEPDVIWQDSVTPERYARAYHELYQAIRSADPTARIAAAGVTQATPLRLAYLDRVLTSYRSQYGAAMPVDIWTVHGFVLREERDSWGVDIPPGFDQDQGRLYEVSDHGRLDLFESHMRDFRNWMAKNGYRNTPLALTEFGILMPEDYGFPGEFVQAYMRGAFDLLLTMSDPATGYPQDQDRLVQRWAWFSLNDMHYGTGNLADLEQDHLTALGLVFRDYLDELGKSEQ